MKVKQQYGHFINGLSVQPILGNYLPSINPDDETIIASIAAGTAEDVAVAVSAAKAAQVAWGNMRAFERGKIVAHIGRVLRANIDTLAKIESEEMGMPLAAMKGSLNTAANYFEYYGGLATTLHGETLPVGNAQHAYTRYEPFGVVGIITPWNAPLNQTARSIAPALAAGNAVVHKPSEYASIATLTLLELITKETNLPNGLWNVITGRGTEAGAPIVEHKMVRKVAFTGSLRTGKVIGKVAAEKIMPVVLELGGKSPNIIFEDANLQQAVPSVLNGFVRNSGQICSAGTRILVQRRIYEEFSGLLVDAIAQIPVGRDKPFPCLGPLVNQIQFKKVLSYFEVAKEDGATLLIGGNRSTIKDKGYYVNPTIYGNVTNDMRIAREEIFGPVGVLIPFDTEVEAIQIANDSDYGLAAGIFTQNISRVHRVAAQIEAGQIFVNAYYDGGVEAPFGGFKQSGIGREKGMIALKQYTQSKSVMVNL